MRGGEARGAEGDWPARTMVVLAEFPSWERLGYWYASAEYAEALAMRKDALTRRLPFLNGVA